MRVLRFCNVPLLLTNAPPTITPLSLTAAGEKLGPRSVIVPLLHKNPSSAPVLVCEVPTTWPLPLIAVPLLDPPPRVGSTMGVSLVHTTAVLRKQLPRTWPLLLIATAAGVLPGIVLISRHSIFGLDSGSAVMAPLLLTTQAKFCRSMVTRHWPTIWPESLIPYTTAGALSWCMPWPFDKNTPSSPGLLGLDKPTTSPESLIATPSLKVPPRVPRSVIVPLLHSNASSGFVKHFFAPPYFWGGHGTCTSWDETESPVTWPEALIASPRVTPPPSEPRSVIVYVVAAAAGAAAAADRPTATASTAIKDRCEARNRVMTPSLRARAQSGLTPCHGQAGTTVHDHRILCLRLGLTRPAAGFASSGTANVSGRGTSAGWRQRACNRRSGRPQR